MANGETTTNEKVGLVLHKPPPQNPCQQRNLHFVSNPTVLVHDSVWLLTNPFHKPRIPSTQPKSIAVSLGSQAFWHKTERNAMVLPTGTGFDLDYRRGVLGCRVNLHRIQLLFRS